MRQDGWIAKHRLVSFFVLAFLISWPLFLLAGATKVAWVTVVGLFGPAAAAVIVAGFSHGRLGTGQLLGRFLIWPISPLCSLSRCCSQPRAIRFPRISVRPARALPRTRHRASGI